MLLTIIVFSKVELPMNGPHSTQAGLIREPNIEEHDFVVRKCKRYIDIGPTRKKVKGRSYANGGYTSGRTTVESFEGPPVQRA